MATLVFNELTYCVMRFLNKTVIKNLLIVIINANWI